jgi:hypothetical protein
MQIEATSRGEWVLEPEFTEPSRSGRTTARRRKRAQTVQDRAVAAVGGALFIVAAAVLAALTLMLPRLYTPFF